jgi:hypothetical protein
METTVEKQDVQFDNSGLVDEVRVCLGETTELTLGGSRGSSEDKRYIYN